MTDDAERRRIALFAIALGAAALAAYAWVFRHL